MSDPCVPNIGPAQRRFRLVMGLVGAVVAVGLQVVLVLAGSPRPWRLTVILPLIVGAYGLLQAYGKT